MIDVGTGTPLSTIIEKARRAQQEHEQKHNVQLEIPSGLMFDLPDENEVKNE